MDKEKFIRDRLTDINTPEVNSIELKQNVLNNLNIDKKNFKIRFAFIACSVFILLTTTVVLANYDKLFEIINRFAPNYSKYMSIPIDAEYTFKGITLKIESVSKSDNMARIIYSVKDEQNRFDENLSFRDYAGVKGANSGGGPIVGIHDNETGKIYRILDASSDTGFESNRIELRIQKMFYNEKNYEDMKFDIDLMGLKTSNIMADKDEIFKDISYLTFDILEVDEYNYKFPVYGDVWLSNIGIIDNQLHVQIKSLSKISDKPYDGASASCQPYLKDKNGERLLQQHFRFSKSESGKISYFEDDGEREFYIDEYVFDLGQNKIDDVDLLFYVNTCDIISGDWRVSCETKDIYDKISFELNGIVVDGLQIENVIVNPFSVTINSKTDDNYNFNADISFDIIYHDGYTINFDNFSSSYYDSEKGLFQALIFSENEPIIIDKIHLIKINGVVIYDSAYDYISK